MLGWYLHRRSDSAHFKCFIFVELRGPSQRRATLKPRWYHHYRILSCMNDAKMTFKALKFTLILQHRSLHLCCQTRSYSRNAVWIVVKQLQRKRLAQVETLVLSFSLKTKMCTPCSHLQSRHLYFHRCYLRFIGRRKARCRYSQSWYLQIFQLYWTS